MHSTRLHTVFLRPSSSRHACIPTYIPHRYILVFFLFLFLLLFSPLPQLLFVCFLRSVRREALQINLRFDFRNGRREGREEWEGRRGQVSGGLPLRRHNISGRGGGTRV